LPLVFAESGLTVLLAEQGRFAESRARAMHSIATAEALEHTYTLVFALRTSGHAHTLEGRLDDAVALLERGMALCREASLHSLAPNIMASLGYAYVRTGRPRDGIALIEQALAALERYGHRVWHVVLLTQIAEGWLVSGDLERAGDYAGRALSLARERGERGFEAWASRIFGAVVTRTTSTDFSTAREHFEHAVRLAEERGMQPLIAHCHAGLAELYTRVDDRDGAERHRTAALDTSRALGMPPQSLM
jgi:tetratricopeptide (TPR) repeat protein